MVPANTQGVADCGDRHPLPGPRTNHQWSWLLQLTLQVGGEARLWRTPPRWTCASPPVVETGCHQGQNSTREVCRSVMAPHSPSGLLSRCCPWLADGDPGSEWRSACPGSRILVSLLPGPHPDPGGSCAHDRRLSHLPGGWGGSSVSCGKWLYMSGAARLWDTHLHGQLHSPAASTPASLAGMGRH